jgi:hypothetical protein
MHDLDILKTDGARAAVEVTAAADADSIELWKLLHGRSGRWIAPTLRGGWILYFEPTARAKRILKELPAFLQNLEAEGVTEIPHRRPWDETPGSPASRARDLGIVTGDQSATDFPGSIYVSIERPPERTGGMVDDTGKAVPEWVHDFLLDPHHSDVLDKLARSGADERHAFILIPTFSIAPFGVVDMLWRNQDDLVPIEAPDLPDQATHVWLMALWAVGSGLRWAPDQGWVRFARHFDLEG